MPARRCSDCNVNWPTEPSSRFARCPICEAATWWAAGNTAISTEEAFDLLLDAEPEADRLKRLAKLEREDAARSATLCFKATVKISDDSKYDGRTGTLVDWIPDLGSDTPFLIRVGDEFGWWPANQLEPLWHPDSGYAQ